MRICRSIAFLALAAILAGIAAQSAAACSCAPFTPARLARADGAFVGVFLGKRPKPGSRELAVYRFRVHAVLKGEIGTVVEVVDSIGDLLGCGNLEYLWPGAPVGLLLDRYAGWWTPQLCGQVGVLELLRAGRPLPSAAGSGTIALLLGGNFGGARTIALDRRGRVLAYGREPGRTESISVCPGGRLAAELVTFEWGRSRVVLRDLRTFAVVRHYPWSPAVHYFDPESQPPAEVVCRSSDGRDLIVMSRDETHPLAVTVVERRVAGAPFRTIARSARSAGTVGERLYIATATARPKLVAIDLGTGIRRALVALPPWTGSLSVAPGGALVAGIQYTRTLPPRPLRLVLIDLAGTQARLRTAPLEGIGGEAEIAWPDARRLAVFVRDPRGRAYVFDFSLRRIAAFEWHGKRSIAVGGAAFGIGPRSLLAAKLPGGPVRIVRDLLGSPFVEAIAAVHDHVVVRAPAAVK